mgnify:FL=1
MATDLWNELPESTGEFEQSKSFEAIPEGTKVLAHIETAEFSTFAGSDHQNPNIKWCIDEPEDYKGRKFFQTIKVNGDDPFGQYYKPEGQDKIKLQAFTMLSAIDKNSGGNIAKLRRQPTGAELSQYFVGASMMVTLGVNSFNKKNLVRGVSANPNAQPSEKSKSVQKREEAQKEKPAVSAIDDMDSDIPFN